MNTEKLREEFELILKDKLKNIFFGSSDYTFNKIIEAMEVSYQKGLETKPVEVSDAEIRKAFDLINTGDEQIEFGGLEYFESGCKFMRDKQGIAPCKEVEEKFKLPTDKQMIEIAILFNEGGLDADKLADMVGYGQFIVDRLYENGDVAKPSLKEEGE